MNNWIPVSKRLPEENGEYLVTMTEKASADKFGFDLANIQDIESNGFSLSIPLYVKAINDVVEDKVIAWMPLPKPYREAEE